MTTLISSSLAPALATAGALGVACALLSVFVVLRRWAFIGEGISHSGFGGAGVAWTLAVLMPGAFGPEQTPWLVTVCLVLLCVLTALLIGYFSQRRDMNFDAVVGIFLVASLAFGFSAQHLYVHLDPTHRQPWGFDRVFLGNISDVSTTYTLAAVGICFAVVAVVSVLWKEIVSYCFDPHGAHVGGVRTGWMHYLLILLVTVTIIVGMHIAGALLITALIVLPGAIALQLSRHMQHVIAISLAAGLGGTIGGTLIQEWLRFIPAGPAITLVLFAEFLAAYALSRLTLTSERS